jgi:hypothetical protein
MKQITDLLQKGFSAKTILDQILKSNTKAKDVVAGLLGTGYTANQILKSLIEPKKPVGKAEDYMTAQEFADYKSKERSRELIKTGVKAGATVYGLTRLPKALQAAKSAVEGFTGKPEAEGGPTIDVTPEPQPIKPSGQGQAVQEQPLSPINTPPALKTEEILPEKKVIPAYLQTQVGQAFPELGKYTERLVREGQTPEQIYGKVKASRMLGPVVNRYEGETGQSFMQEIERLKKEQEKPYSTMEYIPKIGERMKALGKGEMVQEEAPSLAERVSVPEIKDIAKSFVVSPLGAAELVKETPNASVINVDSKLKKVPKGSLEAPSAQALQAVQDILQIPEIDRSSVVSLFTYDPDENKMYIQYHNGETYKYSNITPEEVEQVASKNNTPFTKGQNIYGAWSPEDKQSLGSALFKYVLSNPKYKKPKKGEQPNPNYVKLETLYDYWKKLRK